MHDLQSSPDCVMIKSSPSRIVEVSSCLLVSERIELKTPDLKNKATFLKLQPMPVALLNRGLRAKPIEVVKVSPVALD